MRTGVLVLGVVAALALGAVGRGAAFSLQDVARLAAARAAEPWREREPQIPDWLRVGQLTYDQWRDIRFRPDRALWREERLPFEVQLFHLGLYFDRAVRVNVIEGTAVRPLVYSPAYFDFGKNTFAERIPADLGWAGFRVHAPIKRPDYFDEVVVFLGASYFRALGRDNVYGLSARGLAVDTVEPSGEEFPRFVEFWLERPAADATSLVVYALLDGPSMAGAYRFRITPGEQTTMDVEARLFARRVPKILGLAPLTSMFFFGENTTRCFDDFRPEVHDSDGLLLHLGTGEWVWRPLDNPTRIDVASFRATDPRGFGLLQRDRSFASHQDLETRAELRPSAWVEPRGDWGAGAVRLITIPTASEMDDNVVAFWVPDKRPVPGRPYPLAYRLSWYGDDARRPPGGRAVATRRDRGAVGTARDGYRYVIDFEGTELTALPAETPPRAVVSVGPGAELFDEHVYKNPVTGGWRLTFQIRPRRPEPVEIRAFLAHGGHALTETWSSAWLP